MITNVFNLVNKNFFKPFSNSNREINYEILQIINNVLKDTVGFVSRETIINEIENYYETHNVDCYDDESGDLLVGETIKSLASIKLRYFVSTGWLAVESDKNFQSTYQFNEEAIQILDALDNIANQRKERIEYTGYVRSIYLNLSNYDSNDATEIAEQAEKHMKDLFASLRGLNSCVKRYIDELLSNVDKTPQEIFDVLLNEYQKEVVLTTFNNLRSKDSPIKYRTKIIKIIDDLLNNKLNEMVNNYIKKKKNNIDNKENRKEGEDFFTLKLGYVAEKLETINETINYLNAQNTKYSSTAKSRVQFLINEERDIEGRIETILKDFANLKNYEFDGYEIPIYLQDNLDEESLYSSRSQRNALIKENKVIEQVIDEELQEKELRRINRQMIFSIKSINDFIIKEIGNKEQLKASEIKVNNYDDVVRIYLAESYSKTSGSHYEIEMLNEKIKLMNATLQDFVIRRAKDERK